MSKLNPIKTLIVDSDDFDDSYDHYRYSEHIGAEHILNRKVGAGRFEICGIKHFAKTVHITYEEVW